MRAPTSYGRTGTYTAAQIEAALVSPGGRITPRFEVFDIADRTNAIGELTMVGGATYSMDANRKIPTGLRLAFVDADPLLPFATTVPYTRLIKPWIQVGMPDGGHVEWPLGLFVWSLPGRRLQSVDPSAQSNPIESWDVTLGDQVWFLEEQGPTLTGWTIPPYTNLSSAIASTLIEGMPYTVDTTHLQLGSEVTSGALSWSPLSESQSSQSGSPSTSWAGILTALHTDAGYTPPRFDDDGNYTTGPMPTHNLFAAEPDWLIVTDRDHLIELPVTSTPRVEQVGNRVFVGANNASPDALFGFAVADANVYLPDHPYAQQNCGLYIDVIDTNIAAGEWTSLQAAAIALLFKRMALVNTVEFSTWYRPGLEPWDLIGLQIPGDPVYDTVHRLMAVQWETDLFSGRMTHKPSSVSGA